MDSEDQIREYILANYELILQEVLPILDKREQLLKDYPYLTRDIKDEFRWIFGNIIIEMISRNRPDIPGEDITVFVRSIDYEHFLTLGIQNG